MFFLNYTGSNFFKVGGKQERYIYNVGMILHKIVVKRMKLIRQAVIQYLLYRTGQHKATRLCNIEECNPTVFQFDSNHTKLL